MRASDPNSTSTPISPPPPAMQLSIVQYVFREGETNVMQDCIADSGGALELAGTTRAKLFTTKGHHSLQTHDLLWTGRKVSRCRRRPPWLCPPRTNHNYKRDATHPNT